MSESVPVNRGEHREHHEFLRECIPLLREYLEDRKRSREQWEKFRSSFIGAIATSLALGIISALAWVGTAVRHYIEHGGGN